ncbi:condensation domain-containing protein [uncultured Methanobrevibacter sp.]|uniref:condensation domain-containing protein n=1 Tax=uncultured Methanobrevibacter sp. TaxID=253161 RepID=UPI0025EE0345|nr:condensation domain-containing protein [uncultured Methanobrevibacter sp.]
MKSNKLEMEYGFEDGCPLSESQLNVYLDESVNDMGTSYNIPFKIKFSKSYSAVEIKEAIYKLAEIYPVLAARIVVVEDNISFRFDGELQISVGSLDDVDSFVQPFELDKCLSRFLIIEEESILCIDCHHLILDGASKIMLLNKLSDILEETAICSVDYGVLRQLTFEENLSSEDLNQSKEFFDIMLSDMDEVYDLMPSIAKDKCDGEHYCDFYLDSSYLKSFLEDHSITYTQFFTSVFAYTLSRFTGSSKVFFNLIVNGRSHVDLTDSVGMFVRTLPLLFNCENQKTDSFLTDSSALIKSAIKCDFYPYSQLANEYGFSSDILFQYAYNLIYNTKESKNIVSVEDLEHDEVGDLSFYVYNHENYFKIRVTYSDKYSKDLIEHFVESYKSIAHEIINKKITK